MDQSGVEKACEAFLETEPFCPRPVERNLNPEAADLWLASGRRYLDTANHIIDRRFEQLPTRFLMAVERSHKSSSTAESLITSYISGAGRGSGHSSAFSSRVGRGESHGGRGGRGGSGFVGAGDGKRFGQPWRGSSGRSLA